MKTLGVITLILVVVIVFIALLVVIYKNFNGTLLNIKEKLDDAKNEFNVKCKDKHELVLKFIKNIESLSRIGIELQFETNEEFANEEGENVNNVIENQKEE